MRALRAFLLCLLFTSQAFGQATWTNGDLNVNPAGRAGSNVGATKICDATTTTNCAPVDPTLGLKVQASVSASITGFAPTGNNTSLAVSSTSAETAIPTGSPAVILITNTGAQTAYVRLGTTSGVVATTADIPVQANNGQTPLTVGSNGFIAAITSTSTTTLNIQGGTGVYTGIAGNASSGGTQNVNLSQVNGVTTAVGTGAQNTGSQRVAVATDTATIAGSAPGTAGTASTNVMSVQGIASMTPVQVSQATASNLNAAVVGVGTAGSASGGILTIQGVASMTPVIATGSGTAGSAAAGVLSIQGIASMTPVQVSQATAASLNATVVGTGTFLVQAAQSGSWTNTVTQATGTNLHVVCDSGCSSSTAPADESTFTFGTTSQSPVGGVFQTTATSNPLTTGKMGAFQVTAQRALFVNLRDSSGNEEGLSGQPVQVSLANTGANGTAIAVSQSGSWTNTVTQATGSNLHVVCDSGCSSSTAPADESTFAPGTTSQSPVGGFFQTTATNNPLTNLQMGAFQVTAQRAIFSNLRNASGTEVGTSGTPLQVSIANTGSNGTAVTVTGSGTAGSAATGVLSIQGIASMTPVNNNITQVNGTTVLTGTGAQGAGAQRVTVATDTATVAGSAPGTAGTASANVVTVQGIASMTALAANLTQVNGNAMSSGAGATGTGTQRVGVAQDTTTIAGSAPGTAGTASAQVVTVQGVSSMTPVQVSQNTAQNGSANLQSAATANGNGTAATTTGYADGTITVNCATCSGGTTINFEGSQDGSNYTAVYASQIGATNLVTTTTTAGLTYWNVTLSGFQNFRARISSYSAGTVTITLAMTPLSEAARVINVNSANLTQVNGNTLSTGTGAQGTGSPRVTVATDTATIAGSAPGTAGSASANVVTIQGVASMTAVQVSQATAANLNATVTGSGSAGSAASGVVTVQGIASMTALTVAQATAANLNATVVQGTASNLLANVGGLAASGASVSGNPLQNGGRAENAEPTAVTNGQAVGAAYDLVGKAITSPFANKENLVEGTASVTGTSSTSLIGVPGSSLFIYVTHVSCFNSGSTGTTVVLQNGSAGTTIWEGYAAASGGGFVADFPSPIGGVNNMSSNTALFFQAGSSTTTLYCNASGYKGT